MILNSINSRITTCFLVKSPTNSLEYIEYIAFGLNFQFIFAPVMVLKYKNTQVNKAMCLCCMMQRCC